ncbi:MAG TPA: COX15/CtaA family protein [Acidimicrobiales bacterium]|nr:COX15/CtaA family protein [Acidimicrobiales bacterium]
MALARVSPPAYRRATLAALVLLTVIVVTGAAVRLTDSGLGCSDWPNCDRHHLIRVSSFHQSVEQGNRLFTGLVVVAVVVAVLGSIRRVPKRQDLVWLSWGLVVGVVGQIVLGGISVLTHLNPYAVAAHFLLSIALVTDAVVLHYRASDPPPHPPRETRLSTAVVAAALAVIALGTVVTGTGPHGGDEHAHRFQFVLTDVARIHSLFVWLLVGLTILLAVRTRNRAVYALLAVEVLQGAVGYTQYFLGVPPGLVAVHIVGVLAVWIAALRSKLALS